jgi:putative transposase
MAAQAPIRRGMHVASALYTHLIFVTTYRRGVPTTEHLGALRGVVSAECGDLCARPAASGGEDEHEHSAVACSPAVSVAGLVGSVGGVSSRLLRKWFGSALETHRRRLWSPASCAASVGGAPPVDLRRYAERGGLTPP